MRKFVIAIAAIVAVAFGAVIASGAIPDTDGNFYACVQKTTGAVRLVDKSETCKSTENRQHWPSASRAVQKTYVVTSSTTLTPLTGAGVAVSCNLGDVATGGGLSDNAGFVENLGEATLPQDQFNHPISPPTGYVLSVINKDQVHSQTARVFVICLEAS